MDGSDKALAAKVDVVCSSPEMRQHHHIVNVFQDGAVDISEHALEPWGEAGLVVTALGGKEKLTPCTWWASEPQTPLGSLATRWGQGGLWPKNLASNAVEAPLRPQEWAVVFLAPQVSPTAEITLYRHLGISLDTSFTLFKIDESLRGLSALDLSQISQAYGFSTQEDNVLLRDFLGGKRFRLFAEETTRNLSILTPSLAAQNILCEVSLNHFVEATLILPVVAPSLKVEDLAEWMDLGVPLQWIGGMKALDLDSSLAGAICDGLGARGISHVDYGPETTKAFITAGGDVERFPAFLVKHPKMTHLSDRAHLAGRVTRVLNEDQRYPSTWVVEAVMGFFPDHSHLFSHLAETTASLYLDGWAREASKEIAMLLEKQGDPAFWETEDEKNLNGAT